MKPKLTAVEIDRILTKLWWQNRTYVALERLAGVTDRYKFWAGRSEEEARAALKHLIRQRIVSGELTA